MKDTKQFMTHTLLHLASFPGLAFLDIMNSLSLGRPTLRWASASSVVPTNVTLRCKVLKPLTHVSLITTASAKCHTPDQASQPTVRTGSPKHWPEDRRACYPVLYRDITYIAAWMLTRST